MLATLIVGSCAAPPPLLLLKFPDPDQAPAALLDKVVVVDARPEPQIAITGATGERRAWRPFPDLATTLRLYLADSLLREDPDFAARLPKAPVRLAVAIEGLSATRHAEGRADTGSRLILSYRLTARAVGAGTPARTYSWTTRVAALAGQEAEMLSAELEGSLRRQAGAIVRDFIRDASPFLPSGDGKGLRSPVRS